jgi:hypothetical protein
MPKGGHFTAWEAPQPMAVDLHEFFQELLAKQTSFQLSIG